MLNCALRNGDAHLKNFGIVYDDVLGESRLAPVYDLVTTAIYLPKDSLALTLNGTTQWPGNKVLRRLGETRITGTPAKIREILERVSQALSQPEIDVRAYIKEHPDFKEVGERMLQEWIKGRNCRFKAVSGSHFPRWTIGRFLRKCGPSLNGSTPRRPFPESSSKLEYTVHRRYIERQFLRIPSYYLQGIRDSRTISSFQWTPPLILRLPCSSTFVRRNQGRPFLPLH